jgi:DNA replication and repair protein RecF
VFLQQLQLINFRGYEQAEVHFVDGVTAVIGDNGQGKSNLLEAIGYLTTLRSFRGAPTDALVRNGATHAILRAELVADQRETLVEIEIVPGKRVRVEVNRQRLKRTRDLLGVVRSTVFSPDDLILVKGSPGERRGYLDDILTSLGLRNDALRSEVDRVLKQRNALLKSAKGRLSADVETTLDVWDAKLVEAGEALGDAREALLERLMPEVGRALEEISGVAGTITATYDSAWRAQGLANALVESRRDDLRRGVSTVGPHRDDIGLWLSSMAARTHASQGEQRSIALAMRLASHRIVARETEMAPLLLLDDVLSELDEKRRSALLVALPECQTVLTTATDLPPEARAGTVYEVREGTVSSRSGGGAAGSPTGGVIDLTDGVGDNTPVDGLAGDDLVRDDLAGVAGAVDTSEERAL